MFFNICRWGGMILLTPTIEKITFLSSAMSFYIVVMQLIF